MSWNLLADEHLYNNFMNITGASFLIEALKTTYPKGNIYFNDKGLCINSVDSSRISFIYLELNYHY